MNKTDQAIFQKFIKLTFEGFEKTSAQMEQGFRDVASELATLKERVEALEATLLPVESMVSSDQTEAASSSPESDGPFVPSGVLPCRSVLQEETLALSGLPSPFLEEA